MIEAYPLTWPVGYKRTPAAKIKASAFKQSMEKAQRFLRDELYRLGARNLVVSSNIPVRKDGMFYTDWMNRKIEDAGVAIYFEYNGKQVAMCCDQYYRVWENVYALGKGIEALRGMERWGVSEFLDRAFTGFKGLPAQATGGAWYDVLEVAPDASEEEIKKAWIAKTKLHHPDKGGSTHMFDLVQKAYKQATNKSE